MSTVGLACGRLREDGETVSEKRVKRLMRDQQIQGKVPKPFKQTTNCHHDEQRLLSIVWTVAIDRNPVSPLVLAVFDCTRSTHRPP